MDTSALGAWRPLLQAEFDRPYWAALCAAVDEADRTAEVYPPPAERFAAFALTPPGRVRVILLGQDPYHEPGQAHGLAFSVRESTKLPPSLVNIYKERESDLGIPPSTSGDLRRWAEQGVLLLNTVLTVEPGKSGSHRNKGWEKITEQAIKALVARDAEPLVAILWGRDAGSLKPWLTDVPFVVDFDPPTRPGICDLDGGELFQRDDDKAETIAERLRVYARDTAPLVDYYGAQGKLVGIDATGPVEDVTVRAIDALRSYGG